MKELVRLLKDGKEQEANSVLTARLEEPKYKSDKPWLSLAGQMLILEKREGFRNTRPMAREMLAIAEQMETPNNVLKARAQMMLSHFWHEANRNDSARYYIDRSLESYMVGPYQEAITYKYILNNKFVIYDYEFNTEDSLLAFCDKLRDIYEYEYDRIAPYEPAIRKSLIFQQYASVYSRLGDYSKAISYMYEALRLIEQDPEQMKEHDLYASTKLELMVAFYSNNQFPQANQYAKEAVAAYEESIRQGGPTDVNAYNALAVSYTAINKPDSALVWFKKCLELIDEDEKSDGLRAYVLLNMGASHTQSGNEKPSVENLSEALRISQSIYGKRHPGLVNFYRYMAESNSAFGHHELAVHHLDSALKSLLPEIKEIREVTQLPIENFSLDILDLIEFYMQELVAMQKANPGKSGSTQLILDLASFTESVLNQKQQDFIETESVLSNARLYTDVFEHTLVELALLNEGSDELMDRAAHLMYISKSIVLNSEIQEFALINDAKVPETLRKDYLRDKRQLQQLDNKLNKVIATTLDKDSINLLNTKKLVVRTQFQVTTDSLRNQYWPERELDNSEQSLSQIRTDFNLKDGAGLIEFFFGNYDIVVLGISEEKSSIHRLPIDAEFRQKLSDFIDLMSERPQGKDAASDFSSQANYFYSQLLAPVLTDLGPDLKRLVIVPDGALNYLSFELLTTNQSSDYGKLNYLINDYLFSYAYSSKKTENSKDPYGHKGLLAFGYKSDNAPSDERAALGDLPGAGEEIDFLKSKFKGAFFMGDRGTKARFVDKAEDYDILHLAVHGKADTLDRYNSRLIFNGDEDYEFNSFDLFALNLNPSMVVLSACETSGGRLDKGEGVFSVARSFATKGIPSIVTTLWKVNDLAGADIITTFYANLERGLSKDEALRKAKLSYLKKADNLTSHPYYWGSYVVMGDTQPIEIKAASSFSWYWLLAVVIAIVIISRLGKQPSGKPKF